MVDYELMYVKLFSAITQAIDILQKVQIDTEELYINAEPSALVAFPKSITNEVYGMGNIEKFDAMATQYDTPGRQAVANIIAAEIRACVQDGATKQAIDYGCGTGMVGLQLLDVFASLLLIDASANMVDEVTRKLTKLNAKSAKALCCDILADNPPDLHADYIIIAQVLLHVKETEQLLSRLHHMLNRGGHLIIVDFDLNPEIESDEVRNGFDQVDLMSILLQCGFTKAHANTFYHGEKMFMNKDASLFLMDAETL